VASEALELAILLSLKDEASAALGGIHEKLGGVGTAMLGMGAAAVAGVAVLGKSLLDAAKAAGEEEQGIVRMSQAVRNTGADWGTASGAIESYLSTQLRRVAMDDGAGRESITRLMAVTHDYKSALEGTTAAAELAAGANMSQEQATNMVALALAGNTARLEKYGIEVAKGASATEIFAAINARFGGSAEAMANSYQGAQAKLSIAMGNLKETVGAALLPVLTDLTTKFADLAMQAMPYVEQAIGQLIPWFTSSLMPALGNVWAFIQAPLIPTLLLLGQWLSTHIPAFIVILKMAWDTVLMPALQAIWTFIQTSLIPILTLLGQWLAIHVPLFIAQLKVAWDTVLMPALQNVWGFIQNSLVPVLILVGAWLGTHLPPLVAALQVAWDTVLMPALQMAWEFISTKLVPILMAIAKWLGENIPPAIDTLVEIWNTILLPAIQALHKFVDERLIPKLKEIKDLFEVGLKLACNVLTVVLDGIKGAFAGVQAAIQWVIDRVNDFRNAIANLQLPDWLTPGSPTPLENALTGIGNAMRGVTAEAQGMGQAFAFAGIMAGAMVGAMQGGTGGIPIGPDIPGAPSPFPLAGLSAIDMIGKGGSTGPGGIWGGYGTGTGGIPIGPDIPGTPSPFPLGGLSAIDTSGRGGFVGPGGIRGGYRTGGMRPSPEPMIPGEEPPKPPASTAQFITNQFGTAVAYRTSGAVEWQESWGEWPGPDFTNWQFNTAGFQEWYDPQREQLLVRYTNWYRRGRPGPGTTEAPGNLVRPGLQQENRTDWGFVGPGGTWVNPHPGGLPEEPEPQHPTLGGATTGIMTPHGNTMGGVMAEGGGQTPQTQNVYQLIYQAFRQEPGYSDAVSQMLMLALMSRLTGT